MKRSQSFVLAGVLAAGSLALADEQTPPYTLECTKAGCTRVEGSHGEIRFRGAAPGVVAGMIGSLYPTDLLVVTGPPDGPRARVDLVADSAVAARAGAATITGLTPSQLGRILVLAPWPVDRRLVRTGGPRIHTDFVNVSLNRVLHVVAMQSALRSEGSLGGSATLQVSGAPSYEVLSALASTCGARLELRRGVVKLASPERCPPDPHTPQTIEDTPLVDLFPDAPAEGLRVVAIGRRGDNVVAGVEDARSGRQTVVGRGIPIGRLENCRRDLPPNAGESSTCKDVAPVTAFAWFVHEIVGDVVTLRAIAEGFANGSVKQGTVIAEKRLPLAP